MRAQDARASFARSNAWLRRARSRYARICRPWCERVRKQERFLARVKVCAERAQARGLWASPNVRDAMWGILSVWRRDDKMNWWSWRYADRRRMFTYADKTPCEDVTERERKLRRA